MSALDDLIVDEADVDRELLAVGLAPYVRVGKSGQPRPTEKWGHLSQKAKVLAVLLAFKAAHLLGLRDGEAAGFTEVHHASGVAGGTVGRVLRELAGANVAAQNADGEYYIPSMVVPAAVRQLSSSSEGASR